MRKSYLLITSIVLLSGCAVERVSEGLRLLDGQKLKTAISYLGYPDSKMEVEGKTVYTWNYDKTFTGVQAISQPYSGSVYGTGGVTGYSGQTTAYVPTTYNHNCTIRLMTDSKSTIVGSALRGNPAGCREYADALDGLIENSKTGGAE